MTTSRTIPRQQQYWHSTQYSQCECRRLMSYRRNRDWKLYVANVPGSQYSWERKFQGAKVPGPFRSGERKFRGARQPGRERVRESQGAKVRERIGQGPIGRLTPAERTGPEAKRLWIDLRYWYTDRLIISFCHNARVGRTNGQTEMAEQDRAYAFAVAR